MTTHLLPQSCPQCGRGRVLVQGNCWPTPQGWRQSVWLDEPAHCQEGCLLSTTAVIALLRRTAWHTSWQLALDLGEEGVA